MSAGARPPPPTTSLHSLEKASKRPIFAFVSQSSSSDSREGFFCFGVAFCFRSWRAAGGRHPYTQDPRPHGSGASVDGSPVVNAADWFRGYTSFTHTCRHECVQRDERANLNKRVIKGKERIIKKDAERKALGVASAPANENKETQSHNAHKYTLLRATMPADEVARPKTSGRGVTPKELEEWARKKSPASSPKQAPASPTILSEPEPEPEIEMRKGLPDESSVATSRLMSGHRGVSGAPPWNLHCHHPLPQYDPHRSAHMAATISTLLPPHY